jgi:hypothetical protein
MKLLGFLAVVARRFLALQPLTMLIHARSQNVVVQNHAGNFLIVDELTVLGTAYLTFTPFLPT